MRPSAWKALSRVELSRTPPLDRMTASVVYAAAAIERPGVIRHIEGNRYLAHREQWIEKRKNSPCFDRLHSINDAARGTDRAVTGQPKETRDFARALCRHEHAVQAAT